MSTTTLIKTGAFLIGLAISAPALAAGDQPANTDNANPPPPPVDCRKEMEKKNVSHPENYVWSEAEHKCVEKTALNDRDLYIVGRDLALAGSYDSALDALGAIRDKHDAMVLTMIGYATRKLGHTDEGIAIYHQALAIDPNNPNTHEYLGEGYLSAGRIDLASVELTTLERLCGVNCKQYKTLERAIAGDPSWD